MEAVSWNRQISALWSWKLQECPRIGNRHLYPGPGNWQLYPGAGFLVVISRSWQLAAVFWSQQLAAVFWSRQLYPGASVFFKDKNLPPSQSIQGVKASDKFLLSLLFSIKVSAPAAILTIIYQSECSCRHPNCSLSELGLLPPSLLFSIKVKVV